jgi:hypothetical protein
MSNSTSTFPHTSKAQRADLIPQRRNAPTSYLVPRTLCIFLLLVFALVLPAVAADKLDRYDSAYVNTLNMTDEEIAELYGVDSTKLNKGPTLQELNEEDPKYIKRDYDHRQQVIVGSVVMLCIAVAMVLMNNYNPKR